MKAHGPVSGLEFHFVPLVPALRRFVKTPFIKYLSYDLWQKRAYRAAAELHREVRFDLVHHVTWNGFREPGYLWQFDVPFIWGPVGGTQNYPSNFLFSAGVAGAASEGLRSILNKLQLQFSRRVRQVGRRAELVLAANSQGQADLKRVLERPVARLPESGSGTISSFDKVLYDGRRPLRILWSGHFRHCKALHLLLEALRNVETAAGFELRILGDGPLAGRWRRLARKYCIDEHCEWPGFIPFEDTVEAYRWDESSCFPACATLVGRCRTRGPGKQSAGNLF